MAFQVRTFQGVRFALFHYNAGGAPGGVADLDLMQVHEPHPRGLMRPIPSDNLPAGTRNPPRVARGWRPA